MSYKKNSFDPSWIQDGITSATVSWAEDFGKHLCQLNNDGSVGRNALTTSQLRRFFGEVKRIESDVEKNKNAILMLKPSLAYAIGRHAKDNNKEAGIKDFGEEMLRALNAIRYNDINVLKNDFANLVKVLEAVVAYHKYYGGK